MSAYKHIGQVSLKTKVPTLACEELIFFHFSHTSLCMSIALPPYVGDSKDITAVVCLPYFLIEQATVSQTEHIVSQVPIYCHERIPFTKLPLAILFISVGRQLTRTYGLL